MSFNISSTTLYIAAAGAALIIIILPSLSERQEQTQKSNAPTASEHSTSTLPALTIGGEVIEVSIADTPQERAQGLSGIEGLAEGEGLFFIFNTSEKHGFWMKGMLFSIDIIWIDTSGSIVDIKHSLSPSTYPKVFKPRAPARYVLEVPAGFAETHNVEIGDRVQIPNF